MIVWSYGTEKVTTAHSTVVPIVTWSKFRCFLNLLFWGCVLPALCSPGNTAEVMLFGSYGSPAYLTDVSLWRPNYWSCSLSHLYKDVAELGSWASCKEKRWGIQNCFNSYFLKATLWRLVHKLFQYTIKSELEWACGGNSVWRWEKWNQASTYKHYISVFHLYTYCTGSPWLRSKLSRNFCC